MKTCLARQPIVDMHREVHAYEILFRATETDVNCAEQDGDQTSARVVLRALMEIGIDRVTSGRPGFINCTERLLSLDGLEEVFSPKAVVLEVLETVEPTPALVRRLRELAGLGFRIALDDFTYSPKRRSLLDVADYVKIDIQALSRQDVRRHVRLRDSHRFTLLAEKVETYDEFRRCADLGFDLFQGWFFCKPETLRGGVPSANRLATVQVIARLQDENVGISEVVRLVSLDAALSYCILRLANGALYARPVPVESVQDGVMRLGISGLRRWIAVIMMAGLDDKPRELLVTAIVRGRMCESLGRERGLDPEAMFTLGLFSVLDALLDCPLRDILSQVPLAPALKAALLLGTGAAGGLLAEVLGFERGLPSNQGLLGRIWLDAVDWTDAMLSKLAHCTLEEPVDQEAPRA